jgi:hypothetical protein
VTKYRFKTWDDGLKDNPRTINVISDLTLTALYEEVTEVPQGTFSGNVSAQEAPAETVTITITRPDGAIDTLTAATTLDGSFSADYTPPIFPGTYKAKAHIDEDGKYLAADSEEITFTVGKEPRTITLTYTPK